MASSSPLANCGSSCHPLLPTSHNKQPLAPMSLDLTRTMTRPSWRSSRRPLAVEGVRHGWGQRGHLPPHAVRVLPHLQACHGQVLRQDNHVGPAVASHDIYRVLILKYTGVPGYTQRPRRSRCGRRTSTAATRWRCMLDTITSPDLVRK